MISAIIVAGGSGSRLPGAVRKQYRPLAGRTVLARTLAVFEASPVVDTLLLVVPEEDFNFCRENYLAALRKPVEMVPGGRERQESVYHGLCRCPQGEDDLVVIHDGVRPLLAAGHLAACVDGARRWGGSILAVPAVDTLKQVSPDGEIQATLDRRSIWLAQTPQAFRTRLIRRAHERARREGIVATDDAQLVERLGAPVHVVAGSRANLKITTAEDLLLAEALLQAGWV
ncbi:MAG: 2-C-methyl-D-erythritol 4-phosphate cytidylyltransferase [Desulfobacterales bacterium]|nr:2-C-methyl-D-erythritol 4-phosphate cytidylyltransferase [Desulfobacterales bacterium]